MSALLEALRVNRELVLRFLKARGCAQPEDIYQELWTKFLREQRPAIGNPAGYIIRCAHNLLVDEARATRQRSVREHAYQGLSDPGDSTAIDATRSDRILIARENVRAVRATIAGLGERTATIFYRFRIDGLTRPQIAAELNLSVSAVEKHLTRAYRALIDLRGADAD